MGRLILFIIIIGAILAGIWFYVPGGDDMLRGLMGNNAPAEDSMSSDDSAAGGSGGGEDMSGSDSSDDMSGEDMGGEGEDEAAPEDPPAR